MQAFAQACAGCQAAMYAHSGCTPSKKKKNNGDLTCNDSSGLQGFAQAHVVCQAAMQAGAAQEGQPGNALLLVGPQLALQPH